MPNKKGVTYNSKSVLILKNYNPEDIQKLLNSGLYKKDISKKLGVHYNAFIKYIKENNLIYTNPYSYKKSHKVKYNSKEVITNNPLENFNKILAERKLKRTLKEFKDSYDKLFFINDKL